MKQFTIRGLDPEIEEKIRDLARQKQKSINQVIKEIIQKELKGSQYPASSLKNLAGKWSKEEANEFKHNIATCEQIDKEIWE
ncbi:MAG: hypothetical protein ACLFT8_05540 [Desulfovermiculus sp.]